MKGGKDFVFSALPVSAEFRGYDLDKAGNPTFRTAGEGFAMTDAWAPDTAASKPTLIRTIKVTGDKAVTVVLARGTTISGPSDGVTEVGTGLLIRAQGGVYPRSSAADKTLTVTLKPGESAVLGYSYR